MKKIIMGLILLTSVSAFADLFDLQKQKVFSANKLDLKNRFGAQVLCSNDLRIACYAFHFKSWEELVNPDLAPIAGYGSEPEAVLSKIKATGDCKKIKRISPDQAQVEQNGENYIQFRRGAIERTKMITLVRGDSYLQELDCDLTKLYEDVSR